MSRKSLKKSTSKYRGFKTSPLIPIVAVIEVLVLIGVSTFAWLTMSANKHLDSGVISAEADSGLDIDFKYANENDYINIWNYVDKDFEFEPVTSLDGRNVFIPTTGTFNSQQTGNMVFRDGTVNDINSKYLNIDFELTNTANVPVEVYLNNNSYFKVRDTSNNLEESRALRLAFYPNNGKSGNVGSSLIHNSSNSASDGNDDSADTDPNAYTVYFDNTDAKWGDVYAYFYDSDDGTSPEYQTAWPGVKMARVSGKTYSVTITNPSSNHGVKYDQLIFNNGDGTKSSTYTLTDTAAMRAGYVFKASGNPSVYSAKTVYFLKPKSWNNVYCHAFDNTNSRYYTTWPGDEMKYVGSGVYSYTYNSSTTGKILFDNGSEGGTNQTEDFTPTAGNLYYCTGATGSNGRYTATPYGSYSSTSYKTIYFFNTYGWNKPYASVSLSTSESINACDIAMVSLSGNVYYCTVPNIYDKVYFRDKEQGNNADLRTEKVVTVDGTVYRPKDDKDSNGYHYMDTFIYSTYIQESGYPVISPGVSAGFQRPYSPVVNIDSQTGAATEVIPAFSNSIDNYIYGSHTPVFTIEAGHMLSLSMVLWLEGTDSSTDGSTYPSNNIALKLEFATLTKNSQATPPGEDVELNVGESDYNTYYFYDRTREIWTSDRQSTESGVTVAPVMQLYDNTIKRGYLMTPKEYSSYDGKKKVSCWEVDAPRSITTLGHDIIFRRVNPYDEDEVWNYWHAGRVAGTNSQTVYENLEDAGNTRYEPYSIADSVSGTHHTISFTAFSDGSPLSSMSGVGSNANVPEKSCGGLWGNHTVRTVTLYDGIIGQPLDDEQGVMTVQYNYTYKVGNTNTRTVSIEYKASTGSNGFYYFIMPNVAYANKVDCTFKRYKNFNDKYAINSKEKNPNITFVKAFKDANTPRKVIGDYVEITQKTSQLNSDNYDWYWGSDMLYVQTNVDTKDLLYTSSSNSSGARIFQVKFSDNSSNSRYVTLYYNGSLNPSGTGTGFACVVPNERVYTKLRLQRGDFYGNTIYNETSDTTVHHDNNKDITITDPYTGASNTIYMNHMNNKGIETTHFEAKITIQTTQTSYGKDTYLYAYTGSNKLADWPGVKMYSDGSTGSNPTLYKFSYNLNVSKYRSLNFAYWVDSNNNNGGQSDNQTINIDDLTTEMVYESKNQNNINWTAKYGTKETIKTNPWTIGSWPHLTFAS